MSFERQAFGWPAEADPNTDRSREPRLDGAMDILSATGGDRTRRAGTAGTGDRETGFDTAPRGRSRTAQ